MEFICQCEYIFQALSRIAKSDYQLRHVCPHGTSPLLLDRFSWNLICEYFFPNFVKEIKILLNSDKHN